MPAIPARMPHRCSEPGTVAPAVLTAGLGILFVPLGLLSLVTFGPGFPLLCVAGALIAIGFERIRSALVTLRRQRAPLILATAGLTALGGLGGGHLILADDVVPRLTGAALLLGALVVAAWLWFGATAHAAANPSGIGD